MQAIESILDQAKNTRDFPLSRFQEEWEVVEGGNGTSCITLKFRGVPRSKEDGALIKIPPGVHTPVQYISEKGKSTVENVLDGKAYLLHVNRNGEFFVYSYDSRNSTGKVPNLTVQAGELMCIYALKEQDQGQPLGLFEYVKPGFTGKEFETVAPNTGRIGDTYIPAEFWDVIESLDNGNEDLAKTLAKDIPFEQEPPTPSSNQLHELFG